MKNRVMLSLSVLMVVFAGALIGGGLREHDWWTLGVACFAVVGVWLELLFRGETMKLEGELKAWQEATSSLDEAVREVLR